MINTENLKELILKRYSVTEEYNNIDIIFDIHRYLKHNKIYSEIKQGWVIENNKGVPKLYLVIQDNKDKYYIYVDNYISNMIIHKNRKQFILTKRPSAKKIIRHMQKGD